MRGHLKQRSKGSWTAWVELPRSSEGKRRQRVVTIRGNKREAEARLAQMLHELETGSYVRPAKLTVAQFLKRWLDDFASMAVRARTLEGYRDIINTHLIPALGNIPLPQLSGAHLQAYYSKALAEGRKDGKSGGLSARSVTHHHRVLYKALSDGVKSGILARNVAQAVDPPRASKTEIKTLDNDGVRVLLEVAKETIYHPLVHLAVYTGMRRSELLALRWKSVDLDLATLSVVQVMHRLRGGRFIFEPPKTAKSRRMVALSPTAVLALRAHKERQASDRILMGASLSDQDLVFCHPDGSPLKPDTVTHAFADLMSKARLPKIRFHDLRHTHASLMLKANVHPKIVSERLGHASVSITLDTYSHVAPGLQAAAALRFDEGMAEIETSKEPAEKVG